MKIQTLIITIIIIIIIIPILDQKQMVPKRTHQHVWIKYH